MTRTALGMADPADDGEGASQAKFDGFAAQYGPARKAAAAATAKALPKPAAEARGALAAPTTAMAAAFAAARDKQAPA